VLRGVSVRIEPGERIGVVGMKKHYSKKHNLLYFIFVVVVVVDRF
jgi:hypothetical protein